MFCSALGCTESRVSNRTVQYSMPYRYPSNHGLFESLNLILAVPKSQEVSGIKLLEAQAVICEPLVAFGDLV